MEKTTGNNQPGPGYLVKDISKDRDASQNIPDHIGPDCHRGPCGTEHGKIYPEKGAGAPHIPYPDPETSDPAH